MVCDILALPVIICNRCFHRRHKVWLSILQKNPQKNRDMKVVEALGRRYTRQR